MLEARVTNVCWLTEGGDLLRAASQLSGGGCSLGCLSGGLKVCLNLDARGSECSRTSACSFSMMCVMCKIMGAASPGDPAADPAGSCEVSTCHERHKGSHQGE